jgi:putative transposase
MKTSKFSDSQIMAILNQGQSGTPAPVLCREHGISSATYYKWRAKFGGMDASMISRLKELEAENARLKRMYADVQLDAQILKEAPPSSDWPWLRNCSTFTVSGKWGDYLSHPG